jgi:hypothetical protein
MNDGKVVFGKRHPGRRDFVFHHFHFLMLLYFFILDNLFLDRPYFSKVTPNVLSVLSTVRVVRWRITGHPHKASTFTRVYYTLTNTRVTVPIIYHLIALEHCVPIMPYIPHGTPCMYSSHIRNCVRTA